MSGKTVDGASLYTESGGNGGPLLVMLHGLGANAAVWRRMVPIIEQDWPGRWMAVDLRGHGRSDHAPPYGYATHAADVATAIGAQDEAVFLLGHSMGGVVAMALATGWFGVSVKSALAFGVKIGWTGEEVDKMKALAAAPVRFFERREEAIERYLKVSGLIGLVDPDSPEALSGIAEESGKFRLAADGAINAAAGPSVEGFYRAATAPVRLAAGDGDKMVGLEQMRALDPQATLLPGLGHNCHVEAPDMIWDLFKQVCT